MLTLIPLRVWAGLALVAALVLGWWRLTAFYERKGYERATAEMTAQARAQEQRNRELQRAAELRYTVAAETRDRFITRTITEIRYAAAPLADCRVPARVVGLLRDAAACASGDSGAACGADLQVPAAAPAH